MPGWLTHILGTPFYKQERSVQRRVLAALAAAALLLIAVAAYQVGRLAGLEVNADSARWEQVVQARAAAFRLPLGVAGFALALLSSSLAWGAWIRSLPGRSACQFDQDAQGAFTEGEAIRAEKIANQGRVCAALLLGSLAFWGWILR